MQLIDSIPLSWKRNILDDEGNLVNLCSFDWHLIKSQIYVNNRLNSKKLYGMQNNFANSKRTWQAYFESLFEITLG